MAGLGIVMNTLRAATGPGALIMDEYDMNVQTGAMGILRVRRTVSGQLTE